RRPRPEGRKRSQENGVQGKTSDGDGSERKRPAPRVPHSKTAEGPPWRRLVGFVREQMAKPVIRVLLFAIGALGIITPLEGFYGVSDLVFGSGGDDEPSAVTASATIMETASEWSDKGFVIGDVEPCRLPNQVDETDLGAGFPISANRLTSKGKVHVAVLFVDFPDAKARHGLGTSDDEYISPEEVFDEEVPPAGEYLAAMSYRELDMKFWPHHEWLRMSATYSSYSDESSLLVSEAIALADRQVPFQRIDSVVVFTDPKAELGPSHALVWGNYGSVGADEQIIKNAIVRVLPSPSDSWGWAGQTIAHELSHNLGLPDLYDTQSAPRPDGYMTDEMARFVGDFGIMGGGGGSKLSSNEMLAWSRWQLGWIHDTQIACVTSFPGSVKIAPVAVSGGTKAAVVPLTETMALVVESRRQRGYDLVDGALVYTVDSTVSSGGGPIVVHNTSSGDVPDTSVLLHPGESVTVDGYTVTVEDATLEGDFIKISAP
ncbi:MAG: hypothetical protein VB997_05915, partial [Opitutales bacterium]